MVQWRDGRRLRLQYPGAIYHVMSRGNGRQDIVRDDADLDRLQQELGRASVRCGWKVYAFVILSNHLHVVLKTPQPNLARGMQGFLSAYANAWARRHRFCGHVFQGRYRTELVEDETYLWTVTRYVHLNPVCARLVEHPAAWRWSSYPGYAHRGRRLEWVAYDELLASWQGEFGGSDADAAGTYRRYVTTGVAEPPESPWWDAYQSWVLGSGAFVDRVRANGAGPIPSRAAAAAGGAVDGGIAAGAGLRGDLFLLRDPACGGEPAPGARGPGLRGAAADDGNPHGTDASARRVAARERAQPDAVVRGLAPV
jgi:REP element-mobilizing transposase RayT